MHYANAHRNGESLSANEDGDNYHEKEVQLSLEAKNKNQMVLNQ